jgi:hypothetical protein
MLLFPPLETGTRHVLDEFPVLIDKVFPLEKRFLPGLGRDVAELSRLLTGAQGERGLSYLGKPALLSAYLRYFLPWNVYRLSRLLPALPLSLSPGDAVTDLGSGPLTLPLALWISRPELRGFNLEFRCLDRTGTVLEAGLKLFHALAGPGCPWTIKTVRASLGSPVYGPKAALVTALNVFNEQFRNHPGSLASLADKSARLLLSLAAESGVLLAVEPGIPRSGEFIAALRSSLGEYGRFPSSPCPHRGLCPLPGAKDRRGKGKWCHFAFETTDAPPVLRKLSAAAGLPKERAVLSFLLAAPPSDPRANGFSGGKKRAQAPEKAAEKNLFVRIISDAFPLDGGKKQSGKNGSPRSQGENRRARFGRYGCSARGLVLVAGEKDDVDALPSGALPELPAPVHENRDPKSGALLLKLRRRGL